MLKNILNTPTNSIVSMIIKQIVRFNINHSFYNSNNKINIHHCCQQWLNLVVFAGFTVASSAWGWVGILNEFSCIRRTDAFITKIPLFIFHHRLLRIKTSRGAFITRIFHQSFDGTSKTMVFERDEFREFRFKEYSVESVKTIHSLLLSSRLHLRELENSKCKT